MSRPTDPSRRPRTRGILLSVVGALVILVVVPMLFFPADLERLVGRTDAVTATVVDHSVSRTDRRSSGSSAYRSTWFDRYTVTWTGADGVIRTADTTLVTPNGWLRSGPTPTPGTQVAAQWVPGTDRITIATLGQSVAAVVGPLVTALVIVAVGALGRRLVRRLRSARP